MTIKEHIEKKEIIVSVSHVCSRCKTESTPVAPRFGEYLPHGWSHLTYIVPAVLNGVIHGPLDDNQEYDFCFQCSQIILGLLDDQR